MVSFSPMHHWTEHNIRVHTFTCVLALQIAHLMRYQARHAGLHLSVRALLAELAGIEETVLLYQGDKGRPKARRMLTETTPPKTSSSTCSASTATHPANSHPNRHPASTNVVRSYTHTGSELPKYKGKQPTSTLIIGNSS